MEQRCSSQTSTKQIQNLTYVVIQNPINNDPIVVGGLGDHSPYRNKFYQGDFRGTLVYPGISYPFFVTNANLLQVTGTSYQTFGYHAYPNVTTVITTSNVQPEPVDFTRPVKIASDPPNGAINITTTMSVSVSTTRRMQKFRYLTPGVLHVTGFLNLSRIKLEMVWVPEQLSYVKTHIRHIAPCFATHRYQ